MKQYGIMLATVAVFGLWSCNKTDPSASTPIDTSPQLSQMDRDFMNKATYGNNAEVDAGQMAMNKGMDSSIRNFGMMMVNDHSAAQTELQTMATNMGVALPQGLDAEHEQKKQMLGSMSGRSFDSMYIHMQVEDHKKTIALFEQEAQGGSRTEVKNYANDKLPKLREHLQHAQMVAEKY